MEKRKGRWEIEMGREIKKKSGSEKSKRKSRLQTRIVAWLGGFSVFFLVTAVSISCSHLSNEARQDALMICRMVLSQVTATQNYVREELQPVMYDIMGSDEFHPEAMSTTYVARSVVEGFQEDYPGIYFKFATEQPRNELNLASDKELKVIALFREDTELEEWTGVINRDGIDYISVATPIRFNESCQRCHGDPTDAPGMLIERYGDVNGFHRPLDSVAIRSVGVPINSPIKTAIIDTTIFRILMTMFLVCLFILSTYLIKVFVLNPLEVLRKGSERVGKGHLNEIIELNTGDEIQELAEAFNDMAARINDTRAELRQKVEERTEELNQRLNEMELFNQTMVGRELRMIELKKEINKLLSEQGLDPKYKVEMDVRIGYEDNE